jgi:hypothetical protein
MHPVWSSLGMSAYRFLHVLVRDALEDSEQILREALANLAQSTGHLEELAGDLDAAEREYARSSADLQAYSYGRTPRDRGASVRRT